MRKLLSIVAATGVALLAAAAGSHPASAQAACSQWDVSWLQLKQTNGYIVGLPSQNGAYLNGRANLSQYGYNWVRPFSGGYATGWTYGSRLTLTIYWDFGGAGNYDAWIYSDGSVHGYTTDRYNSGSSAGIWSTTNARCKY
jgi:hypothetical protein